MRTLQIFFILLLSFPYPGSAQKNADRLFCKAKGALCYPFKNVSEINNFSKRKMVCDGDISSKATVFFSDSICDVRAIFKGKVASVVAIEDFYVVIIEYGTHFFTYAGVINPTVKKADTIEAGQIISSTGKDLDGRFCVKIYLSNATSDIDPFPWFKPEAYQ